MSFVFIFGKKYFMKKLYCTFVLLSAMNFLHADVNNPDRPVQQSSRDLGNQQRRLARTFEEEVDQRNQAVTAAIARANNLQVVEGVQAQHQARGLGFDFNSGRSEEAPVPSSFR